MSRFIGGNANTVGIYGVRLSFPRVRKKKWVCPMFSATAGSRNMGGKLTLSDETSGYA